MFYIKLILVGIWLAISSTLGTIYSLVRWGNPTNDRVFGRLFSWGALKILGVRIEAEGLEYLRSEESCIYVANHQSNLDLAVFGPIYPRRTIVIGKKELIWVPFFGLFFVAAGNILLDRQKGRKAFSQLRKVVQTIRMKKVSVWIFPEGTRNKSNVDLLPFKKGPFFMAILAGAPVVPIVCAPLTSVIDMKKKSIKGGNLKIRVLPPILTHEYSENQIDELTRAVREKMLEAFHGLIS